MLVACQLAGLSALEAYYAGVDAHAQLIDHLDRAPARATRDSHPVLFELEAKGRRLAFVSAPRGGGSDLRRPLHDDKACAFQMLHKPLGDDLGHEFVGVVDALTTLIAECEGERRGKVGQVCGREPVGVGHRQTKSRSVDGAGNIRTATVFVAMLLALPVRADSTDISARRLLSNWKSQDPMMSGVAEVIAAAFQAVFLGAVPLPERKSIAHRPA
jgi:hypothetical protein